jgi:hypothetical protein
MQRKRKEIYLEIYGGENKDIKFFFIVYIWDAWYRKDGYGALNY